MFKALRAQAFGKRITLFATAFVLAVSSLTAYMPFVLSQDVGAAPVSVNTVTASGVTTDSMTLNFNVTTDWSAEWLGSTGIFEVQVDNNAPSEYQFPIGTTQHSLTGVQSFVQTREAINVTDSSWEWTDWQKFNVVVDPVLVNVDPYYVVAKYKGVAVDITVKDLTDATGVSVTVDRSNGGPVTKTATQKTIDSLNAGATKTTAPIVIQQGSYDEAGSSSWNQPTATWTPDTIPTSVTVTITRSGGDNLTMTKPLGETAGTFASRSQVMPVYVNDLPQVSVTTPDIGGVASTKLSDASKQQVLNTLQVKGTFTDNKAPNYLQLELVRAGNLVAIDTMHSSSLNSDGTFTYNFAVPANLANGVYSLFYTGTDFENGVTTRYERVFTIDNTAPVVSFQGSNSIKIATNKPTATVSGTTPIRLIVGGEQDGSAIDKYIYVDGTLIDNYNSTHRNRDYNLNTVGLTDGTHTLTGVAIDEAGNKTTSSPIQFIVDNSGPAISEAVLSGASVSSTDIRNDNCSPVTKFHLVNGEINLEATVADSLSDVDGAKYKVRKVSANGCTVSSVYSSGYVNMSNVAGDTWSAKFNTKNSVDSNGNPLEDGKYTIMVVTKDSLGNESTQYIDIEVDNTSSNGTFVSPANLNPNSGMFTIVVDVDDAMAGLGVQQVVLRDATGAVAGNWSYNVKTGAERIISGPAATFNYVGDQASGALSITFNTADLLADGQYNLRLFTKDQLGNGRSNIYASMVTDNTPITATADTFAMSGNAITPNVVVDETPASQSWAQISGPVGGVNISNPNALMPTFTVMQDGAYVFGLTTVDGAGNEALSLFSFTYITPDNSIQNSPDASDDSDDDSDAADDGFIGPAFTSPADAIPPAGESDELGVNDNNETGVQGSSNEQNAAQAADTNRDGSIFGLAWYWWLLILAGLATIGWWIAGAIRRRNAES